MKKNCVFNTGDRVSFSFDDEGVVRYASGIFVEESVGGLYKVLFEGTNISFECLPWAVRPLNVTHPKISRLIKKYTDNKINQSWAGSYEIVKREEFRRGGIQLQNEMQKFLKWLKI